jgi:GH24 family phage-related lysozyme (muramidase)
MLNCTHKLDENQKLNEELFKFIVKGEDIKLTPYFDIVNVPTIGYGINLNRADDIGDKNVA